MMSFLHSSLSGSEMSLGACLVQNVRLLQARCCHPPAVYVFSPIRSNQLDCLVCELVSSLSVLLSEAVDKPFHFHSLSILRLSALVAESKENAVPSVMREEIRAGGR
jgi:hypothetical protein